MAKIIISLTPKEIGQLLLGKEVSIEPSVHTFDNLTDISIKFYQYDSFWDLEVTNHD